MQGHRKFPVAVRPGTKLILLYLLVAYIIPGTLVGIAGVPDIYLDIPVNRGALAILIVAFATWFILGNLAAPTADFPEPQYRVRFLGIGSQVTILAILAAAAAYGFATGLSGFRYSDVPLSELNSPLAIAYALVPTLLQFFLLVYVFYDAQFPERKGLLHFLRCGLLLTALGLSANGIASMLVAALGAVYMVFPGTFRRFLLSPRNQRTTGSALGHQARLLLMGGAACAAAICAWIVGEAIKRGEIDTVLELVTGEGILLWFVEWLVQRLSPSYISLITALDHFTLSLDWHVISDHLMAPVRTFMFRANYVLLQFFDVPRPEAGSIMRINYTLITAIPSNPREGTSPGLIAGFLFTLPFPMNFSVLIGYLVFVQRFASRLIAALPGNLTVAGWPVFLVFMLPLFASPIDFLLIVDDGLVAFLLLIALRQWFVTPTADTQYALSQPR